VKVRASREPFTFIREIDDPGARDRVDEHAGAAVAIGTEGDQLHGGFLSAPAMTSTAGQKFVPDSARQS
jgi:hypothetical protein